MLIEKSFSYLNPVLTPNFVHKTLKKSHDEYIHDIFTFISCTSCLARLLMVIVST